MATPFTGEMGYLVAPRREQRDAVAAGWQEVVRAAPGVTVVGGDALRLTIVAGPEAAEALRERLGSAFHFEEVAARKPSS